MLNGPRSSLDEDRPEEGEDVFVFDACWKRWSYAKYQGASGGKHVFFEGHDTYGTPRYVERPTHFFRVVLPGDPRSQEGGTELMMDNVSPCLASEEMRLLEVRLCESGLENEKWIHNTTTQLEALLGKYQNLIENFIENKRNLEMRQQELLTELELTRKENAALTDALDVLEDAAVTSGLTHSDAEFCADAVRNALSHLQDLSPLQLTPHGSYFDPLDEGFDLDRIRDKFMRLGVFLSPVLGTHSQRTEKLARDGSLVLLFDNNENLSWFVRDSDFLTTITKIDCAEFLAHHAIIIGRAKYDDQADAPPKPSVCRTFERAVNDMRYVLADRNQDEPYAAASSKLNKKAYACRNGDHPCDTVDVVQALIRAVVRADTNGGLFPKGE